MSRRYICDVYAYPLGVKAWVAHEWYVCIIQFKYPIPNQIIMFYNTTEYCKTLYLWICRLAVLAISNKKYGCLVMNFIFKLILY
jgi:hypothetical protein